MQDGQWDNKMKVVQKTWGHELWIVNNDLYCGKQLFVRKNRTSSEGRFHYHKIKDETFFILTGVLQLEFYTDEAKPSHSQSRQLSMGDVFHVPPLMRHRFSAIHRDCRFIEFSTHHEDSDSYYEGARYE